MKRLTIIVAVLAATFAIPSTAAAGEPPRVCAYSALNHKVTITLNGDQNTHVSRDSAGHINLEGVWCGNAATVTNTDSISITGDAGSQTLFVLLGNGGFRPGFTNETGISDEIEFAIALGSGTSDSLGLIGTKRAESFALTQVNTQFGLLRRINLNATETTGVDDDITLSGADYVYIAAKGGPDQINAQGSPSDTQDDFNLPLIVYGGGGNDHIYGGAGEDKLFGGKGDDHVYGNGGNDFIYLNGDGGGDVGQGGAGTDTCSWDPGDTCGG